MQKLAYLVAGLAAGVLLVWLASFSRTPAQNARVDPNATSAYQRALDEQAERVKRYVALLQSQENLHNHAEDLVNVQEQLLKRQAADFDRVDKILDTWEQQQKQYQKHLDTLAK